MQASPSDELFSDFYAAAAGRLSWQQPLDKLAALLGLWVVQIIGVDKRTGAAIFSAESTLPSPLVVLDYLRRYQTTDPRVALTMATPDGQWMHCHEHLSKTFVATSEFYQDFLIPHGGRYLSSTKLVDNDETVFMVGLMRGYSSEPLSNAEAAILSLVQFHLSRAMQIFIQLRSDFAELAMARQLLGQFKHAMLLVDEARGLWHSNDAAKAFLTSGGCLVERDGYLRCTSKVNDAALSEALQSLQLSALQDNIAPKRRALSLSRTSGSDLRIFISSLKPHETMGMFGTTSRAMIVLHDPDNSQAALDPFILAECFDLTPAEARVAALIAAGSNAKEIAKHNGSALATVRCHINRVMEKAGVSRQTDLVRALLSLPIRA